MTQERIELRDAALNTDTWLVKAKRMIDEAFTPGHAQANPELVAAFLHTAATSYCADVISKAISGAADRIADEWGEQAP